MGDNLHFYNGVKKSTLKYAFIYFIIIELICVKIFKNVYAKSTCQKKYMIMDIVSGIVMV